MTYDSARGVIVANGPYMDGVGGETWEWNGQAWEFRTADGPSPRDRHAMVYDSIRGVSVLFGGFGIVSEGMNGPLGDTWEWNGVAWTLRSTTGPAPRDDFAMAFDSTRSVTVLFGGYDTGYDRETWEWNGAMWTLRATNGPLARANHAMAYDPLRGVTVLFGGYDTAYDGETWEWNGSTWTLRATTGPLPRTNHAMAFDPIAGEILLFGGYDNNLLDGGYFSRQLWSWDGSSWTLLSDSGTDLRGHHRMEFDAARGVLTVFAGQIVEYIGPNLHYPLSADLLTWNGANWALAGPGRRAGHTLTFEDFGLHAPFVFGGRTPAGLSDQTWVFGDGVWTLIPGAGPSPRDEHAATFDDDRGVIVLFGGDTGSLSGETWEWSGSWTLSSTTGPSPRKSHSLSYDRDRDVAVLFGGNDGALDGETWEWDGASWSLRATTGPSPRQNSALAYDAVRQQTLLFGGDDGALDRETWTWDGATWTLRSLTGPTARDRHTLAYDAARGVVVLYGGDDGTLKQDAWEWNGAAWSPRSADTTPILRDHAMTFDSLRGRVVIHGGVGEYCNPDCKLRDDMWELQSPSPCEDCNNNGTFDLADLAAGTSQDCNGNQIPDECDLASGVSGDMDANGVPDECDPDCNGNGVPDSVDLADGTLHDNNGSGYPDECECADTNGDSAVDIMDLANLLANFGTSSSVGDVDRDGDVDLADLAAMLSQFGSFC